MGRVEVPQPRWRRIGSVDGVGAGKGRVGTWRSKKGLRAE